ncbi:hypothetical protein G6F57_005897 [Rhizopus arrhizus]|uniref:Uncharacterized protein n=1 Tax=Rhizopus oryzae TaxID=64495 RepID=A0A9P6XAM5_RHIOR|nr:hypothetical protein G6F23_004208 [Rhizopus arrhizus]KAG1418788.1 hypothetical protein G6F58_004910 [Rhizopus delemar]KAG0765987.1 hypothetical protein G6F24_003968 [Rhizopus arrhizus]KAG0790552.1 hypothetical protein G6F21_005733 [Rhizopus arrhizus]KAG0799875.1 hypothetical protein G6F22_002792 [Rhizopus arrhizus]
MSEHVQLELGIAGPDKLEIISEFISLVCISVLATALGSKTFGEKIKALNYGRFIVILLYTLSWAFAVTSAVVVSTNNNNMVSCTLGMLSCDIFYCGSKIAIYAWLIERIHLVTAVKTPRLKTNQYRFHLFLLTPYIIILVLMLSFRNIYLESDGTCTIGLQLIASIPLLVYDFFLNFYLTWLFMSPLMNVGMTTRANWRKTRLYKLARRTLVASIVSLLISFINVLVVVITKGHERGLVCLTMCTVDVTVNVVTVHWVTINKSSKKNKDTAKNKTVYTGDRLSVELTFDADEPGNTLDKHAKFNFGSLPEMDNRPQSHQADECDSLKSVQYSQTSVKPLQQQY